MCVHQGLLELGYASWRNQHFFDCLTFELEKKLYAIIETLCMYLTHKQNVR